MLLDIHQQSDKHVLGYESLNFHHLQNPRNNVVALGQQMEKIWLKILRRYLHIQNRQSQTFQS